MNQVRTLMIVDDLAPARFCPNKLASQTSFDWREYGVVEVTNLLIGSSKGWYCRVISDVQHNCPIARLNWADTGK
jgi:hemolysin-activating ACP:hemolysin acyltransferase